MESKSKTSSRKRLFENSVIEGTSGEFEHAPYKSEDMGGTSSRRRFFRNLRPQQPTEDEQCDDEIGTSSRRRFFRNVRPQQPTEDEQLGKTADTCSYGQAHYQRQNQDVITEYKDFGDNIYQCTHCNAYYWREERNSRGVYGFGIRFYHQRGRETILRFLIEKDKGIMYVIKATMFSKLSCKERGSFFRERAATATS